MKLEKLINKEFKHLKKEICRLEEAGESKIDLNLMEMVLESFQNRSGWYGNDLIRNFEANKEMYRMMTDKEYKFKELTNKQYQDYQEMVSGEYRLFDS